MIGLYEVVFFLTGVMMVFAMYNVVLSFRQERPAHPFRDIMLLLAYHLISTALNFVTVVPIVNLLLFIGFTGLLSWSVGLSMKKGFLAVVYTIGVLGGAEILVGVSTGYVVESLVSDIAYRSVFSRVAIVVVIYAISLGIRKLKHVKKDVSIPVGYWLLLFTFPIVTLFLLLVILQFSAKSSTLVALSSLSVLLMNALLFTIYDRIMFLYEKKLDDMALAHLNSSYKKQLEMMKASLLNTRSFQHDMKRHFSSVNSLMNQSQFDEAKAYVGKLQEVVAASDLLGQTGNMIVDSILNFEWQISTLPIERVKIKAQELPKNLNIMDYDLTTILSNLLSNAFRGANQIENGDVSIFLSYQKGVLLIRVENDFNGELKVTKGVYESTQSNQEEHGFGIKNIKRVLHNYEGQLTLTSEANRFCAEVMLYC